MKKKLQKQLSRYYTTDTQGIDIKQYLSLNRLEFESYIDKLLQPGMNRVNYGIKWDLDHIVPVHLFDLSIESELQLCYNYQNIFPLYKEDNKNKGGSVHFSIELLQSLPWSPIIEQLLNKCYKEKTKYDKYLA